MFQKNLIPYFSEVRVIDVTPVKMREWQNKLLDREPAYSQTYIKSLNNQLTAFFNFCVRFYGLKANPLHIAKSIGKSRSGRIDFYTLAEFNAFMEALKESTKNKAVIMAFELLFYSGIRCGELFALTKADFDAENCTIDINKNFGTADGKTYILPPKTPKSKRIVTLPSKVALHLQDYLQSLYQPQPKERIFSTINKYTLQRAIKKASTLAGLKKIRIHDFRHSHASLLIELGFSPLLISERLGHEKIETTLEIYSHIYPSKSEVVAQKLNDFVK
jgi:integrase